MPYATDSVQQDFEVSQIGMDPIEIHVHQKCYITSEAIKSFQRFQ